MRASIFANSYSVYAVWSILREFLLLDCQGLAQQLFSLNEIIHLRQEPTQGVAGSCRLGAIRVCVFPHAERTAVKLLCFGKRTQLFSEFCELVEARRRIQ